ncbi:MAG: hypothetical protein U0414_43265 [Polyangiaceae bacterium]
MIRKTILVLVGLSMAALAGCGDSNAAKPDSSGAASSKPAASSTGSAKAGGGW